MRRRLKIAFLSQNTVVPLDNGGRIRNFHLLRALAAEHEVHAVLTEAPGAQDLQLLEQEGIEVHHVPKPESRYLHYVACLCRGVPFAMAIQANPRLSKWVLGAGIDVVVSGTPARSIGLRESGWSGPIVIDTQNLEHIRLPSLARSKRSRFRRLQARARTIGTRRFEQASFDGSTVVVCSNAEASSIAGWRAKRVVVVENGVDLGRFPARTSPSEHPATVAFTGDLSYAPNVAAAELLARDIAPALLSVRPDIRIIAAGRGASAALRRTLTDAQIEVRSPVDRMEDVLAEAHVMVVPLASGGGTRLKIIEAFGAGLPVVSTTVGAEGLEVKPGGDLLIADRPDAIVAETLRVLDDPRLQEDLSLAGRHLAELRFSWDAVGAHFVSAVEEAAADSSRPLPLGRGGGRTETRRQDVICFSTADWDAPLWSNKQHLMRRLATRGCRVLYLDSLGLRAPGLGSEDLGRMAARVKAWRPFAAPTEKGVYRDSPLVVPLHRFAAARALNKRLLAWRLKRNEHHLAMADAVIWAYTPAAAEAYVPGRHRALVYHCVDDLAAYPGIDRASFHLGEKKLAQRADVCIASSKPLVRHLQELGAREVIYWPNPADTAAYQAAAEARTQPNAQPIIGFVGAIAEHKVDFRLVREVAELRPGWRFPMVGPIGLGLASSDIDPSDFPENVEFWGLRSRDELPGIVAGFDVGSIPYLQNDYTNGVFPMKVFEYLGAGLPVVATSLPSLVGEVEHVAFADDADHYVEAIESALATGEALRETRRIYAAGFSWDRRADQAMELLSRLAQ